MNQHNLNFGKQLKFPPLPDIFRKEEDGVDYINIYSKGKTKLGRQLSNFTHSPIQTIDGNFQSIEGYWYWLSSADESLRFLWGWEAKKKGRELRAADWNNSPDFKLRIYSAMLDKLLRHKNIYDLFVRNELPFRHYYVYGDKIVEPKEGEWILDMWNFLREKLT